MAKIKLSLCVVLWLCCLFAVVSGSALSDSESDQLENENSSPNPNPSEDSKCSFKCQDFKALENDNQQLKKSHAEIIEQLKSLSKQFEEFKNEISLDCGLSLLKPPLRGPPGKPGVKGEIGQVGPPGQIGSKGQRGEQGDSLLPCFQIFLCLVFVTIQHSTKYPQFIKSCSDAMEKSPFIPRRNQSIYPYQNPQDSTKKVQVLCDFITDGGGWTIIQKRSSGPKQQFKQNWNDYKTGFGSVSGNFWLGLDNIRALTQNGDQELRIELEDFNGEKKYAKYSSFSISDASDFYRLTVDGFSGGSTLGDSLARRHSGKKFSTIDKDNDNKPNENCAVERGGGGWVHVLNNSFNLKPFTIN